MVILISHAISLKQVETLPSPHQTKKQKPGPPHLLTNFYFNPERRKKKSLRKGSPAPASPRNYSAIPTEFNFPTLMIPHCRHPRLFCPPSLSFMDEISLLIYSSLRKQPLVSKKKKIKGVGVWLRGKGGGKRRKGESSCVPSLHLISRKSPKFVLTRQSRNARPVSSSSTALG